MILKGYVSFRLTVNVQEYFAVVDVSEMDYRSIILYL